MGIQWRGAGIQWRWVEDGYAMAVGGDRSIMAVGGDGYIMAVGGEWGAGATRTAELDREFTCKVAGWASPEQYQEEQVSATPYATPLRYPPTLPPYATPVVESVGAV
eukprot:760767-Rhodomonas_salina.2